MNDREMFSTLIKEVIEENDGIYNWSWFPVWDDHERAMIIESDPNLWREKILENDWMVNNPVWNVFEIGMYYVKSDGEVTHMEDLTVLVDKKTSVNEFIREYKNKWDGPIYIEWIDVLGADGGHYEDVDKPSYCQIECHTDGDTDKNTMASF